MFCCITYPDATAIATAVEHTSSMFGDSLSYCGALQLGKGGGRKCKYH